MRSVFRATVVAAVLSLSGMAVGVATAAQVGTIQEFSIPGTAPKNSQDITEASDGNMWFIEQPFVNPTLCYVARITPKGQITEFPVTTYRLLNITTGPDGAVWMTTYEGNVVRMSTNGVITNTFPVASGFYSGGDITTGPDGNLWITGNASGAPQIVSRLTPNGVVTQFPVPNAGYGASFGITAGPDGNLWFTDTIDFYSQGFIGRITPAGVVTEFPVPQNINGDTIPNDITTGGDGNLWYTDEFDQIGKVTPQGQFTMFTVGSGAYPGPTIPSGITKGQDGNVWYTVYQNADIVRITPNGTRTTFALPAPFSGPMNITPGPKNTLWFTEYGSNNIVVNRVGSIQVCPSSAKPGCTTTSFPCSDVPGDREQPASQPRRIGHPQTVGWIITSVWKIGGARG